MTNSKYFVCTNFKAVFSQHIIPFHIPRRIWIIFLEDKFDKLLTSIRTNILFLLPKLMPLSGSFLSELFKWFMHICKQVWGWNLLDIEVWHPVWWICNFIIQCKKSPIKYDWLDAAASLHNVVSLELTTDSITMIVAKPVKNHFVWNRHHVCYIGILQARMISDRRLLDIKFFSLVYTLK